MNDKLAPPVPAGESFAVDCSAPPYEVPCPVCSAYALEACHDQARDRTPRWMRKKLGLPEDPWPEGSKIIRDAHEERWTHWRQNPGMRVKATKS